MTLETCENGPILSILRPTVSLASVSLHADLSVIKRTTRRLQQLVHGWWNTIRSGQLQQLQQRRDYSHAILSPPRRIIQVWVERMDWLYIR